MKIKSVEILFIVLTVFIISCEYNTNETYSRNIDKNVSPPSVTIDLNIDADTVLIFGSPSINFNVKLNKNKLYSVKFFVNNDPVANVNSDNNGNYTFWFNVQEPGTYNIRAQIITSSGTGSIADKIGREGFLLNTKNWTLIYTDIKPKCKTSIVDGRLKITWDQYIDLKSHKYIISINDGQYKDSTFNTSYIDSTFIGNYRKYSVTINDKGLSCYWATTDINYISYDLYYYNKDSCVYKWKKSPFYNNISGYRIDIGTTGFSNIYKGPNDTTFVYKNGIYGEYDNISFFEEPKKENLNEQEIGMGMLTRYYGLEFISSNIWRMFLPLKGDKFYYALGTKIYKYAIENKIVLDSLDYSNNINFFTVSPKNEYVLYQEASTYLYLKSGLNLSLVKKLNTSDIIPNNIQNKISLSDYGTGVFYNSNNKSIVIYDLVNAQIYDTINVYYPFTMFNISDYKISSDGSFIFINDMNAFYKISKNNHNKIWSSQNYGPLYKYYEFFPDINELALYDGSNLIIKKCDDFSTIKTIALNNSNLINIDFNNNKILTFDNNTFHIYDLNSGNLITDIPTGYLADQYGPYLFNDYLLGQYAYQLKLNLN